MEGSDCIKEKRVFIFFELQRRVAHQSQNQRSIFFNQKMKEISSIEKKRP
ncbi:hypothetical protein KFK09_025604 [Dendrobium nobile]|uniref:Uncharacterized protein n=1 Tax=Dendrobium nobile TaxID=94219 RepID=A0A8T3A5U5_DENNO|nr:hypothetical protein KFK09_025604 [Dendrobium nobile]